MNWEQILLNCGVAPSTAVLWGAVFDDTEKAGLLTDVAALPDFLGQILHESAMLEKMEENLDYSAERLMQVWPQRFPTLSDAQFYAHSPEALANKVYGGRMGNTRPGDGWKYRGRAPIGVTGYTNYQSLGHLMGQDLDIMPELLSQPHFALEATLHWWENRIPDSMLGETAKITKLVNGGLIGLEDRQRLTDLARTALA